MNDTHGVDVEQSQLYGAPHVDPRAQSIQQTCCSIYRVTCGVWVQFALGGHTLLGDEFAVQIGQKVAAINIVSFRNEAHASKDGAAVITNTVVHLPSACIELHVDATRGQAFGRTNANHTCLTVDHGQLDQFVEVIHLCGDQFLKPSTQHTLAIVKGQAVVFVHGFRQGLELGVQPLEGLVA